MEYRVYLLGQDLRIRAAETFTSASEIQALEIATILHDACSDAFAASEVWQGDRLIIRMGADDIPQIEVPISAMQQGSFLELAERFQQSFACVRESRRLMSAVDNLKARRHIC